MTLRDHVPWVPLAGLGLVVLALGGVAVLGVLDLLAVLAGASAGEPVLVSLLATAVPYLAVGFLLGLVGVALLVWLLVRVLRTASDELDGGALADVARYVERRTGLLSRFGVADGLRAGRR